MATLPQSDVELHKDLVPYINPVPNIGRGVGLFHPLVYSLIYHPSMNQELNGVYSHKRAKIRKLKREAKKSPLKELETLEKIITLYERPHRIPVFFKTITKYLDPNAKDSKRWLTPKLRKHLLVIAKTVWVDSEKPSVHREYWALLFARFNTPQDRRDFMSGDDTDDAGDRNVVMYNSLDAEVQIYRGEQYPYINSAINLDKSPLSWSLDLDKATWFSERFASAQLEAPEGERATALHARIVPKDRIYAYLGDRGEHEVILLPLTVNEDASNVFVP